MHMLDEKTRGVAMRALQALSLQALAVAAYAQSASPPPTIPTPAELSEKRLQLETDPAKLPARERVQPRQLGPSDSDTKIEVVRYVVSPDAPARLREALPQLTAEFVGKDKTLADMADAARKVTAFMQSELGLYLGLAYVPEQDPDGGVIRLEVLEGRLDAIELNWKEGLPVRREVVERYLAQLRPGSILYVRDVERVIFLVNDLRGIAADFEIRPGRTPGTAMLVVTPMARSAFELSLDADNANARSLGVYRLGATVVSNSPFGAGDSATATLTGSKGLTFGLASYTRPIGDSGWRLGASLSALKYKVDKDDFPLGLKGTATTASVFSLYPFIRSRNVNTFVIGTLDGKSYRDFDGANTNPKRVINVTLGLTGDLHDGVLGGGLNSLDALLTSGRITFDTPPVGLDAPAEKFAKLTLRYARLQNIVPGLLQAYGSARFQKAFQNLDVTEQFRAGGPDGVRAFPQGEGSGDNGQLYTLELRVVPPAEMLNWIGGRAFISLFYDWAKVKKRDDASGLGADVDPYATFSGGGLAAVWNRPVGWELRLSIAKPTTGKVANKADESSVRAFVHLSKNF